MADDKTVTAVLAERRATAERELADAVRQLERAQLAHRSAARRLATLQKAETDPERLLRLVPAFMAAIKGGDRGAIERFLNEKEDQDLRSLLLVIRLDTELAWKRNKREEAL